MKPLRDGDLYMPAPRKVGPFGLDGPTASKRGWNVSVQSVLGPGSYESVEAALLACGSVLHDPAYAWGVLYDVRKRVNWRKDRTITVDDLVEHLPRKQAGVPTLFEVDQLSDEELTKYENEVHATLALIKQSRRSR